MTTEFPSDILNKVANSAWNKIGCDKNDLPKITPDKLRQWMPIFDMEEILIITGEKFAHPLPKENEPETWMKKMWYRIERCRAQHERDFPERYAFPNISTFFKENGVSPSNYEKLKKGVTFAEQIAIIKNIIRDELYEEFELALQEENQGKWTRESVNAHEVQVREKGSFAFSVFMSQIESEAFEKLYGISNYEDSIVAIHTLWHTVNEKHKGEFKHPLGPIVEAFLKEKSATHISTEDDRKHPVAILKHPMGSIKNVQFTNGDTARLREFATPESIKHVETQRKKIKNSQQSFIPDVIPLEIAPPADIQPKTKAGAVPHVIRIFFEALMALEPKQTQGNISFTLGDLIKYLYPDGKFNRTNQLPYILNALDTLHFYATVPFHQPSGNTGKWRPVVVRNVLDRNAKNEDLIFLDVKMPPDATQGMLVEKQIIRRLGKKSAAQFSAYLSACAIWDKHGTAKGKLIDPTHPIVNRDTDGYLVDVNGNRLIGSKGKPIENPYRSDAIAQLEREPNPSRTKYPTLSNEDLIKACGLNSTSNEHRDLIRAKEYWTQLEKDGIVSIDRLPNGWRIMPSENHMRAYRAMTEAIKKLQQRE